MSEIIGSNKEEEISEEQESGKKYSKEEARELICEELQKIAIENANGGEPGLAREILRQLEEENIDPNEAVRQVIEIESRKQDSTRHIGRQ